MFTLELKDWFENWEAHSSYKDLDDAICFGNHNFSQIDRRIIMGERIIIEYFSSNAIQDLAYDEMARYQEVKDWIEYFRNIQTQTESIDNANANQWENFENESFVDTNYAFAHHGVDYNYDYYGVDYDYEYKVDWKRQGF